MRRLTIALSVAVLALAACDKKKDKQTGGTAGTGSAVTAGSGSAGSAAGSGSAGSAAGTGSAGSAAGSGGATDPATATTGTNKAGNCPSAVAGAVTAIVDDPAAAGKVVLSITAKDPDATATIRKRVAHLVEVQAAPDTTVKHTGDGTGGGVLGFCPVLTTKDVKLAAADIEGGSKVTLEPQGQAALDALKKEVADRVAETTKWMETNIKSTETSGGGGGVGGGKGEDGSNHSGKGDGTGKGGGTGGGHQDGTGGGTGAGSGATKTP